MMNILEKELKLVLVGDARVGKSSWISYLLDGFYQSEYTPTDSYNCERIYFSTNIGCAKFNFWDLSASCTAQDRAKWIENCDAAIIMVDLADQASIENAVSWYNPTEISWSDELGDTPFFHATYLDPDESSNKVIASQSNRRPIGWILEQLTGRVEVEFLIVYSPDESISRAFDPEFLKQIAPETFSMILDDDEENL